MINYNVGALGAAPDSLDILVRNATNHDEPITVATIPLGSDSGYDPIDDDALRELFGYNPENDDTIMY